MSKADELKDQGAKLFHQRDYEASARIFQQAMDAYEADGQTDMMAEMQVNIGLVHTSLGEHQQALEMMQEALHTFQDNDDALRAAKVLGNMGRVYTGLGDKEQAYNCYRQAADVFEEFGENELHGETLVAIGSLQIREGKISSGAATYSAGLASIGDLSASQKIIKGLTGAINRITGGGSSGEDS